MNETLPNAPVSNPASKTSGLAVTSLVLGILSLTCFSILTAIPGVICGHISLSRIKQSAGALGGRGLAIGGLVTGYIGIALAIFVIPMMLAIAIPNFVKARDVALKNVCDINIAMIESAKQQWAKANGKQPTDVPTAKDLAPYLPNGMPICPAGGAYTINAVGVPATCSFPKHQHTENSKP